MHKYSCGYESDYKCTTVQEAKFHDAIDNIIEDSIGGLVNKVGGRFSDPANEGAAAFQEVQLWLWDSFGSYCRPHPHDDQ